MPSVIIFNKFIQHIYAVFQYTVLAYLIFPRNKKQKIRTDKRMRIMYIVF